MSTSILTCPMCKKRLRGVELGSAVGGADGPILIQPAAALIAEAGPQMVLATALVAAIGQFSAWHGHKRTFGAFDDLQIAYHECIVERDRAKGLESFVVVFHELDPDFGDNHSCSPLCLWHMQGCESLILEGLAWQG